MRRKVEAYIISRASIKQTTLLDFYSRTYVDIGKEGDYPNLDPVLGCE